MQPISRDARRDEYECAKYPQVLLSECELGIDEDPTWQVWASEEKSQLNRDPK
jgi:hypothetical protein